MAYKDSVLDLKEFQGLNRVQSHMPVSCLECCDVTSCCSIGEGWRKHAAFGQSGHSIDIT